MSPANPCSVCHASVQPRACDAKADLWAQWFRHKMDSIPRHSRPLGGARDTIRGSIVGGREDLAEAIAFAAEGKVRAEIRKSKLEDVNKVFADLKGGTVNGRAVLVM
jgi:D-arabinose 1-dehydrogenase-like Zn-dependent alcohol dehydrogenase